MNRVLYTNYSQMLKPILSTWPNCVPVYLCVCVCVTEADLDRLWAELQQLRSHHHREGTTHI
jgi:hypothetical protein